MDLIDLCHELLDAGSTASPDLWDRFAEAVDQAERWMDGEIAHAEGKLRGELLDTVSVDLISTAINMAYDAGKSARRVTEVVQ